MDRLATVTARSGGTVGWHDLQALDLGAGEKRRLISQTGIWNPRDLAATLTIVSSPDGPYEDEEVEGGFLRYDYRAGSDEGNNTKFDGPMLKHGLQEMHGRRLELPRSRREWPDRERLAHRWGAFTNAS
jgi:hypothetical protein